MAERFDQGLGIERHALNLVHKEPYDQLKGDKEADDRFNQQQQSCRAPMPPAAGCQVTHLAAQQDIKRHCAQESAQIGRQFDKDCESQPEDDDKQRITPKLLPNTFHHVPFASDG